MNDHHDHIINLKRNNYSTQLYFSSKFQLLINHNRHNAEIFFSLISKNGTVNTTNISTKDCYKEKELIKRNIRQQRRLGIDIY
jgi:hypothetical protein